MFFEVTLSNDRVLCVYVPSGYSTREQLARGRFFEGLQNYMENKNEGNENKIILGDFNCTMDKMDRDGENKTQDFIDAVPIIPCQNSSWIMGLRIYGEGRTDRVYTDIKIVKNTKINPIMVSFTDHYNVISIDRLSSKSKIGKVSWYFKNSLLCKPEFSSATINFLFLLKKKHKKTINLQQVTGGETPNLVLKKMLELLLKIPPLKRILKY